MTLQIPDGDFAAFIFDCDGTLTDNMPLHYQAWTEAVNELGGVFPEELFYSWGGRPTANIVSLLNERFGTDLNIERTVHLKEQNYLQLVPQVQPLEAVVEIARAARGTKPMAVASGGHRHMVEATLQVLGIATWFDAVVCAEDYRHGKPSPEPFLTAAGRLGVPAASCLVFEDSPTGLEAARAAGMQWVYVPNPLERRSAGA